MEIKLYIFNGRTDGRTNGRTDEQTDGRTDGRMDGRTDGWVDGQTDGRTDERTNEKMENFPILQDFVPYRGHYPKKIKILIFVLAVKGFGYTKTNTT